MALPEGESGVAVHELFMLVVGLVDDPPAVESPAPASEVGMQLLSTAADFDCTLSCRLGWLTGTTLGLACILMNCDGVA